ARGGALASGSAQLKVRSTRLLRGVNRKLDRGEEARLIVGELQLAVVKVGDGLDEREPEPRTLVGAAGIEPPEAAQSLGAPVEWNARPAICDLDPDLLLAR